MKKILFTLTVLTTFTLTGCNIGDFDTVFNTCVLAGQCNGGF